MKLETHYKYALIMPISKKQGQILDIYENEVKALEDLPKYKKKNPIIKKVSEWDVFDSEKWGGTIEL